MKPAAWRGTLVIMLFTARDISFTDATFYWGASMGHTQMPNDIGVTTQQIDLRWNQITHIPDNFFENHTAVTMLDLASNKLTSFPNVPATMEDLRLNYNDITSIPRERLQHLIKLRALIVSGTKLTSIENITNLPELTDFECNDCKVSQILDSDFQNIPKLRTLNFERNGWLQKAHVTMGTEVTEIDFQFGQNLTDLKIICNDSVTYKIEDINIQSTALVAIPTFTTCVRASLKNLYMSNMNLSSMDLNIGCYSKLDKLDLNSAQLLGFPNTSCLPSLTTLQLDENENVRDIRREYLQGMPAVRTLSLKKTNALIYPNITAVPQLWRLHVDNNPQLKEVSLFYLKETSIFHLTVETKGLPAPLNETASVQINDLTMFKHYRGAYIQMEFTATNLGVCDCKLRWMLNPGSVYLRGNTYLEEEAYCHYSNGTRLGYTQFSDVTLPTCPVIGEWLCLRSISFTEQKDALYVMEGSLLECMQRCLVDPACAMIQTTVQGAQEDNKYTCSLWSAAPHSYWETSSPASEYVRALMATKCYM